MVSMKFWCSLFFISLSSVVSAQTKLPTKFLELGLSANSYKGDLSHQYKNWAGGFNIGIIYNHSKVMNGHFNFQLGGITAQNPGYFFDNGKEPQPTPNKFAKSTFVSLNYNLRVHFYKKNGWFLYAFQGIGLLRFQPKDELNNKLLTQLSTREENETYSNLTFCFPNGLGASYVLPQGYGVGLQAGWLNTTTDYLDNISVWGDRKKNDNILFYKVSFIVPLSYKAKLSAPATKPAPVK